MTTMAFFLSLILSTIILRHDVDKGKLAVRGGTPGEVFLNANDRIKCKVGVLGVVHGTEQVFEVEVADFCFACDIRADKRHP